MQTRSDSRGPASARGRVSRRHFFKSAAAAAVPLIVPASALGAAAPSERITMGFIGIGKQGRGHLGGHLGNGGVQVRAVCDVWDSCIKRHKKQVEDRYKGTLKGGCLATTDFRRVLDRRDIDAVCIATPDHWHGLMCIQAAKAGKDIYCEKPLTRTIGEAREIINAVRRYGNVFQTGSQQRSSHAFRFACELVRNGRIGKLQTVNVNVGGPFVDCYLPGQPTPPGLHWNMWLGPAPMRPYHDYICPDLSRNVWPHWRRFRDYGGGSVTDWGAHHFDIAQWGMGTDNTGPVEIIPPADGSKTMLKMKYANGVICTHGGGEGGAGITFRGTKGKVMCSRYWCRTDPGDIKDQPTRPGEIHLYESNDHRGNWLECIRTRRKPICNEKIGARSVTVCHLVNIGYYLRRPLKWDPENWRFIGDDDANRMVYPNMREPWRL